jgi:hypothetical protein
MTEFDTVADGFNLCIKVQCADYGNTLYLLLINFMKNIA